MKKQLFTALLLALLIVPLASASSTEKKNPLLDNPDKIAEIAEAFGLSTDTLTEELEAGKTIKAIAKEYEIPKEIADQYIKKGHKAHLTQEQLSQIATELNLSTEEVKKALHAHLLKSIFEAKGLDLQSFMESIGVPALKTQK